MKLTLGQQEDTAIYAFKAEWSARSVRIDRITVTCKCFSGIRRTLELVIHNM